MPKQVRAKLRGSEGVKGRSFIAVSTLFALAACGGMAGTSSTGNGGDGDTNTTVKVGVTGTAADSALYIAQDLGYFEKEGLDVEFVQFDSGAKMIAPIGNGQIDVGGGAPSAGLYNAVSRGINLRIVADKAKVTRGQSFIRLVVRKGLGGGGKLTASNLPGLTIAEPAQGTTMAAALGAIGTEVGFEYNSLKHKYIGFAEQSAALKNGSIDGSLMIEPFVTKAVQQGMVEEVAGLAKYNPGQQMAVIFYGQDFIEDDTRAAQSFMNAYQRAITFYQKAIKDGQFSGEAGAQVVEILNRHTDMSKELLRKIVPPVIDGQLNVPSLKEGYRFYRQQGFVQGNVDWSSLINETFTEKAETNHRR